MKITKIHNQYVLNASEGLITVFDSATMHDEIILILSRDVNLTHKGKQIKKSIGVVTLMGQPMIEVLKEMHKLDVKVLIK